ncbi:MAG: class I SAM-dependent methyltransferase, partial [Phocaeicola sp.]
MHTSILSPDKDPMGAAISDFYKNKQADKLRVFSSQFDEDEIPVEQLFRTYKEMSPLEKKALQLAKGTILDIGAGSGCHSLALQEMNKEVTAIDISPLSVEVMKQRGVKKANLINLFDPELTTQYDTLLMLMN